MKNEEQTYKDRSQKTEVRRQELGVKKCHYLALITENGKAMPLAPKAMRSGELDSVGVPLARGDTGNLARLSFRDAFTRPPAKAKRWAGNPEMMGLSSGYPTETLGYDKCLRDCFDKKRLAMTDCRGSSPPMLCKRGRETISSAGSQLPMWDVGHREIDVGLHGCTSSIYGKRGRETISNAGSQLPMWDVGHREIDARFLPAKPQAWHPAVFQAGLAGGSPPNNSGAEKCYVGRLAESTIGKSRDSVSTNINTFTFLSARRNSYSDLIAVNIGAMS